MCSCFADRIQPPGFHGGADCRGEDGKAGAEDLLNKILEDPALMKALAAKANEKKGE